MCRKQNKKILARLLSHHASRAPSDVPLWPVHINVILEIYACTESTAAFNSSQQLVCRKNVTVLDFSISELKQFSEISSSCSRLRLYLLNFDYKNVFRKIIENLVQNANMINERKDSPSPYQNSTVTVQVVHPSHKSSGMWQKIEMELIMLLSLTKS